MNLWAMVRIDLFLIPCAIKLLVNPESRSPINSGVGTGCHATQIRWVSVQPDSCFCELGRTQCENPGEFYQPWSD